MSGEMERALLVSVWLHDSRYHGGPEWPPAPARVFQALVAGSGAGGLSDEDRAALEWLEALDPPIIGSPSSVVGQPLMLYMPNNDLDTVGGDPDRVGEVRTAQKWSKPRLLNGMPLFFFVWHLLNSDDQERYAQTICLMANRLYQFGRGVDMAWASGNILTAEQLHHTFEAYEGRIHRPTYVGDEVLDCPRRGSLRTLESRYRASSRRFGVDAQGKTARAIFSQAPKPEFDAVPYDSPPARRVFELRETGTGASFVAWPLARAATLVEVLRDRAVERLKLALPSRSGEIERVLVGRKADGTYAGPISSRIKIVPLPSIGHEHVDVRIRRLLVEVPSDCPIRAEDVFWAWTGVDLTDVETGEIVALLTPSSDSSMLDRFMATERVWRTVTAAALPESARRRRIEPTRLAAETKGAAERAAEERRASGAVAQALRHAGVRAELDTIRVQREPFDAKGARAEAFSPATRFAKERLWHVEITFARPVSGPLIIGDGRFLGLGVMAPVKRSYGVHAFAIEAGLSESPQAIDLARALRRAVMARVQQTLGSRVRLPTFVSGHEADGSPGTREASHLTFAFDAASRRLLILAPHVVGKREPRREEEEYLATLDSALADFRELRAGAAGLLTLRPASVDDESDRLFAASRIWETVTTYEVTRHTKRVGAAEALSADIRAECRRSGLPEPCITPGDLRGVPGLGLVGRARLTFGVAVKGPIVLGKSRHFGGGLFAGADLRQRIRM